jgi:hypothetical protein
MAAKSFEIFLIMLWDGTRWRRHGGTYRTMELAKDWRSFVKKANFARRSRIDRVVIPIVAPGKTSKKVQKLLDEKYNMDVEA